MISPVRVRWRLSRGCTAVGLLLATSAEPSAAADPARVPARLDWGTSVCGDAQGFPARVQKRTQRVRFVDRREDVTVFLSIEPQGTGLDARVQIRTAAGRQVVSRSIASPDCDDALDALALVVAISLEGRAQELDRARSARRPPVPPRKRLPRPPTPPPASPEPAPDPNTEPPSPPMAELPPPEASAPPEPSAPPASTTAEPAPPEPAPAPPPAAAVVEPPPVLASDSERDVPPKRDSEATRAGIWLGVGVDAEMAVSAAPRPMFGAGFWLELTWERESMVSPSVTLGLSHVRLNAYEHPDGKADFQLNTIRLDVCPIRFGSALLELRPCVAGASGDLIARGHATFFSEDALLRWAAIGGGLQGIARLGPVELRTTVGVEVPLGRDKFRFGPICPENDCEDGVFHTVGPVATRLEVGAGVSF